MSPHFYVNSLVLLPPRKWWVARKKVQTPFYIPCSCHTLYRYIQCYTDSLSSRSFPLFESVQQIYFWENCSHNFWSWSFQRGYWYEFQMRHKKGEVAISSWTRYKLVCFTFFIKNTSAFEGGWVPCGGKTVSTRAHIRKVQRYLRKGPFSQTM